MRLGIGHDAALIDSQGRNWVVTCDQFLEGAHFLAEEHPPASVGYKALVRATSDVVAMAARPRFFLLSLALPLDRTGIWLDQMLSGMARGVQAFRHEVGGGGGRRYHSQPRQGRGRVVLNLTVLGEALGGGGIGRRGGTAWARNLCNRDFGQSTARFRTNHARNGAATQISQTALAALLSSPASRFCPVARPPSLAIGNDGYFRRPFQRSYPAVQGQWRGSANLSDRPDTRRLPFPSPLPQTRKLNPLSLALHGGEDYGLSSLRFQSSPVRKSPEVFRRTRTTRIGEIVRGSGVSVVAPDGELSPLISGGWDPFARR